MSLFDSLCLLPIWGILSLPAVDAYPHFAAQKNLPQPFSPSIISRDSPKCGFVGNPDVYGPGIRIGIYSQALAVWTTKYFIHSQAHILRDSITVFSIALLAVALVFAVHSPTTYAVEFFIVVQILSWNCLTGVRARTSYAATEFQNRTLRNISTEIFNVGALVLHAWFWFRGLDAMKEAPCGSQIWFFGETRLEGWYRVVMKFFCLLALVDHVYAFLQKMVGMLGRGFDRGQVKELGQAVQTFHEYKNKTEEDKHTQKAVRNTDSAGENIVSNTATWNTASTAINEEHVSDESCSTRPKADDSKSAPIRNSICQLKFAGCQIPLFEEIYQGEIFFSHCLNASRAADLEGKHPQLFKILLSCCILSRPPSTLKELTIESSLTYPSVTYFHCIKGNLKALLTLRFPRHAFLFFDHLRSTWTLDPISSTYQMYSAVTYSPPLPPRPVLVLSSSAQLARLPKPAAANRYLKLSQASIDAAIHMFVILQMEFTIHYNKISNLGGLGSVGQLTPFVVGVGGLLLVLMRGFEGLWGSKRECDCGKEEEQEEQLSSNSSNKNTRCNLVNDDWIEAYEEWRAEFKDQKVGILEANV